MAAWPFCAGSFARGSFASTHATLDRRLGRCGDFAADEADAVIAAIERFSALAIAGMLAGA